MGAAHHDKSRLIIASDDRLARRRYSRVSISMYFHKRGTSPDRDSPVGGLLRQGILHKALDQETLVGWRVAGKRRSEGEELYEEPRIIGAVKAASVR